MVTWCESSLGSPRANHPLQFTDKQKKVLLGNHHVFFDRQEGKTLTLACKVLYEIRENQYHNIIMTAPTHSYLNSLRDMTLNLVSSPHSIYFELVEMNKSGDYMKIEIKDTHHICTIRFIDSLASHKFYGQLADKVFVDEREYIPYDSWEPIRNSDISMIINKCHLPDAQWNNTIHPSK